MSRIRIFFLLATTLALATAFAACGGSSDSGSSDVPPQKVLDQTFSNKSTIDSGKMDASLKLEASGDQSGSFQLDLSGPFDSNGSGDAKFDLTAKGSGDVAGQSFDFEAGAIFTGDAGYINWQGTDYKLSSQQYASLSKSFHQSSSQSNRARATCPASRTPWATSPTRGRPRSRGPTRSTSPGNVDPTKLTDAIRSAIEQGAGGGASQAQLQQLQGALPQLDQVSKAIKDASFDVYSGVDDHLLRKLDFNLDVAPPAGGEVKITFDLTLSDVNKPQTVSAPSSSEPLDNLLRQVAPLLGALQGQAQAHGPEHRRQRRDARRPLRRRRQRSDAQCLQNATTAARGAGLRLAVALR